MSAQAEGETWRIDREYSSGWVELDFGELGSVAVSREQANAILADHADAQRLQLAVALLRRLEQWDHMQSAGDGPYWLSEIAKFLGEEKPYNERVN